MRTAKVGCDKTELYIKGLQDPSIKDRRRRAYVAHMYSCSDCFRAYCEQETPGFLKEYYEWKLPSEAALRKLAQMIITRRMKQGVDPGKRRFRSWLIAVTRDVMDTFPHRELAASRDRRREVSLDESIEIPSEPSFDRVRVKNLITQAMGRLADEPSLAALRFKLEGLTYAQIGRLLDRNESLVRKDIFRAKRRLRREIERIIWE